MGIWWAWWIETPSLDRKAKSDSSMERRIRRCYNPAHKKDTKIQWLPVWKMVCISGILICFAGGQFIKSIRGFPESISLGSSVCWGSIDQSNDSSRPLTSQIDKERNMELWHHNSRYLKISQRKGRALRSKKTWGSNHAKASERWDFQLNALVEASRNGSTDVCKRCCFLCLALCNLFIYLFIYSLICLSIYLHICNTM